MVLLSSTPQYSGGALGTLLGAAFLPADEGKSALDPPTPTHAANGALRKPCSCSQGFFSSSLGCQRGERSPKENSACLMTVDDILTDKALRSGLRLVFRLLFMKLMKAEEHAASGQVLQRFPSLLTVLCE